MTGTAKDRLLHAFPALIREQSLASLTLDHICEAAQAHRGSFYHAFADKQAWAEASLDVLWADSRTLLDNCFSASKPPAVRLSDYLMLLQDRQCSSSGCISGCPFFTFGVSLGQPEPSLREKIREILVEYKRYLETTIRDGQAEGIFRDGDPDTLTNAAFHAIEGALSHARILQSPDPVLALEGTLGLILDC